MSILILYAKVTDLWFVESYDYFITLLNQKDTKRFDTMKNVLKRQQLVLSRILLQQAAFQLVKKKTFDYEIKNYTKFIVNQDVTFSISISHSGNVAAICLSTQQLKIGIDVERVKLRNFIELSQEVLTVEEGIILNEHKYKASSFYKLWTIKEALAKATKIQLFNLFSYDCSEVLNTNKGVINVNGYNYYYNFNELYDEERMFLGSLTVNVFNNEIIKDLELEQSQDIKWTHYRGNRCIRLYS